VHDYVPAGGAVTRERKIAMTASCNECHVKLTIHGRRYEVDYCVTCHNPDLGPDGEANMSYMVHRIHNGGVFTDLGDFGEVTYPQDLSNCRKCHSGADAATPQGDNWKNLPNRAACDACHDILDTGNHPINPDPADGTCQFCHTPALIERAHATPNATPNNPNLIQVDNQVVDQRKITYDVASAAVDGMTGNVTICFNILDDGTPLDLLNLPQDVLDGNSWPSFLLAWSYTQDGITTPKDFTNTGNDAAQPTSVSISRLSPIDATTPLGTLAWNSGLGCWVATITDAGSKFPAGTHMRTIGLQGYLRQDLDGDNAYDVALHTPSKVVTVTGDTARREVVDSAKCGACHEWFEGHGGNRVYTIAICTMCHVPNLSSSGRELSAYFTYPEDAQNMKDMIHGIHASAFRDRKYEHVRNRSGGIYYDWSEVTFPAEGGTQHCDLCHKSGTYLLPLPSDLLPTTVRTTGVDDGQDADYLAVRVARDAPPAGTFINDSDWVNSPTASSCFYCHTSTAALGHMLQNGGLLSVPDGTWYTNRKDYGTPFESCAVCHGAGKIWDVAVVHGE
jgi:OmcA/MtrC family decaheme c-type cytochrome